MSKCRHGGTCGCGLRTFQVPKGCKVEPYPCKPLELPTDLGLWDSAAATELGAEGTPVDYYWLDLDRSEVDPLYRETIRKVHRGPFKLRAQVQWPDGTPTVDEKGESTEFTITAYMLRADFEKVQCPPPQPGDVVCFWKSPFWTAQSGGEGMYFIVTDADPTGMVNASQSFVGFTFSLSRTTAFDPARRISNDR